MSRATGLGAGAVTGSSEIGHASPSGLIIHVSTVADATRPDANATAQ